MAKVIKFPQKLAKYLEKANIKHKVLEHKTVYTAYDAAATMGKKLSEIAKCLLILADKNYFLAILPADHNLDLKKMAAMLSQATEKKVKVVKMNDGWMDFGNPDDIAKVSNFLNNEANPGK